MRCPLRMPGVWLKLVSLKLAPLEPVLSKLALSKLAMTPASSAAWRRLPAHVRFLFANRPVNRRPKNRRCDFRILPLPFPTSSFPTSPQRWFVLEVFVLKVFVLKVFVREMLALETFALELPDPYVFGPAASVVRRQTPATDSLSPKLTAKPRDPRYKMAPRMASRLPTRCRTT